MMLVTLMETVNEIGPDQDIQNGTRGRLLKRFVSHLIKKEWGSRKWEDLKEDAILQFLSQVAFTARRKKFRTAITFVPNGSVAERGTPRTQSLGEVASKLQLWLDRHMQEVFMASEVAQPHWPYQPYSDIEVERYLAFAQSAMLVTVTPNRAIAVTHIRPYH